MLAGLSKQVDLSDKWSYNGASTANSFKDPWKEYNGVVQNVFLRVFTWDGVV
jgi:hypothetical protein